MRILLTVHQFFPDFKAGTEVLTLSVAKELIAIGHEVHIFTGHPGAANLSDAERFEQFEYEGITVSRFHHAYVPMHGQTSMIEIGYYNLLAQHYFNEIVTEFRPDCVHHFHLNRLGIGLIDSLYMKGIPQFYTPTDFWMICPTAQLMLGEGRYCDGPDSDAGNCIKHFTRDRLKGLAGGLIDKVPDVVFAKVSSITKNCQLIEYPMSNEVRALNKRLSNTVGALNKLNGIVSPNDFMTNLFVKYGVNSKLIYNCQFGVDVASVASAQRTTKEDQKLQLGFIGTLAPHKGCHILIKALQDLPLASVKLKIYGSNIDFPDYFEELKQLAQGNSNIEFCGTFPNADIGKVIAQFDALVVPSIWYENTPLVIYSAHACRCPVIASNLPGISEVIENEENGLLFEAGNSVKLNALLRGLLSDPDKLQRLGNKCKSPLSVAEYTSKLISIWSDN